MTIPRRTTPQTPHRLRRAGAVLAAVCCATAVTGAGTTAGAASAPSSAASTSQVGQQARHRTVVTTDMERMTSHR